MMLIWNLEESCRELTIHVNQNKDGISLHSAVFKPISANKFCDLFCFEILRKRILEFLLIGVNFFSELEDVWSTFVFLFQFCKVPRTFIVLPFSATFSSPFFDWSFFFEIFALIFSGLFTSNFSESFASIWDFSIIYCLRCLDCFWTPTTSIINSDTSISSFLKKRFCFSFFLLEPTTEVH